MGPRPVRVRRRLEVSLPLRAACPLKRSVQRGSALRHGSKRSRDSDARFGVPEHARHDLRRVLPQAWCFPMLGFSGLASRDVVYEGTPGSARSGAVGEAKR